MSACVLMRVSHILFNSFRLAEQLKGTFETLSRWLSALSSHRSSSFKVLLHQRCLDKSTPKSRFFFFLWYEIFLLWQHMPSKWFTVISNKVVGILTVSRDPYANFSFAITVMSWNNNRLIICAIDKWQPIMLFLNCNNVVLFWWLFLMCYFFFRR